MTSKICESVEMPLMDSTFTEPLAAECESRRQKTQQICTNLQQLLCIVSRFSHKDLLKCVPASFICLVYLEDLSHTFLVR